MKRKQGSILVALLWVVALLAVMVVGTLHTSRLDSQVVKNYGDEIQAHYLALAGIEKAKAVIYQDAATRKKASKNHNGALSDAPEYFRDNKLGRGQFRVLRQPGPNEHGSVIFGITDEESRLNVNSATQEELAKLEEITPEIVAAIIDWRDQDNTVTPGGAESDFYSSLKPPYLPRNGPFETTRELLLVSGVSRQLFMGEDANQNGLLDPEEDDGTNSFPPDNRDGILDAGWSGIVTVDSSVQNVNAAGDERVNVQSADENALTGVRGISSEIAKAIIAYRGQNRFQSIADLLDVTPPPPPAPPAPSAPPGRGQPQPPQTPQPPSQTSQQKLIDQDLLISIADDITISSEGKELGPININTATAPVLKCLDGITQEIAEAIIAYRQSSGFFPNTAALLKVQGVTPQIFKRIASRVTARSETFRILSEGVVTSTGARKRIQAIVRIGASEIETLSYREDL